MNVMISGAVTQLMHSHEDPTRPRGAGGAFQRWRRGPRLQPGIHAVPEQIHPGQGQSAATVSLLTNTGVEQTLTIKLWVTLLWLVHVFVWKMMHYQELKKNGVWKKKQLNMRHKVQAVRLLVRETVSLIDNKDAYIKI